MTCGIYKVTSPTGKVYIGQSVDIEKRFADYRHYSSCHKQKRLYNSLKAHGATSHCFEVLESCAVEALLERERHWQDNFDAIGERGLNCRLTAASDRAGKHSAESIALMRLRQQGTNNPNYGKCGVQASTFGRHRTESECAAIKAYQQTRGRIVQQFDKYGALVQEAKSIDFIKQGYSQGNISSCCTGRAKTHKGFTFQYKAKA